MEREREESGRGIETRMDHCLKRKTEEGGRWGEARKKREGEKNRINHLLKTDRQTDRQVDRHTEKDTNSRREKGFRRVGVGVQ